MQAYVCRSLTSSLIAPIFFALLQSALIFQFFDPDQQDDFHKRETGVVSDDEGQSLHPDQGHKPEQPHIRESRAWKKFAASSVITQLPYLALVIDDVGLSADVVDDIALMRPLTLALLPYSQDLPAKASILEKSGHELMVHLPMEPHGDANPGPEALLTNLTQAELDRRIIWNLSQFKSYIGVNNHMGSKLMERVGPLVSLMIELKSRKLMFLDSLTSPKSLGQRSATALRVPFLARDIFLDNDQDRQKIKNQLDKAVRIAKKRGYAIAIGHPYPETLSVIKSFRNQGAASGVTIVPLSQILAYSQNDKFQNDKSQN